MVDSQGPSLNCTSGGGAGRVLQLTQTRAGYNLVATEGHRNGQESREAVGEIRSRAYEPRCRSHLTVTIETGPQGLVVRDLGQPLRRSSSLRLGQKNRPLSV